MSESSALLIAECPSCQTRFRVTAEQLAVANGRVRCGACLAVFDARETEVRDDKPAPADPLDVLLEVDPVAAPTAESGAAKETVASPIHAGIEEPLASTSYRRHHPILFATASAAALVLLAAGVMALQYEVYVQDPVLREAYETVGIEVPAYRALEKIDIASPTVDERLGAPESLIVRVELTNTAPRHQRFPTLAVRFQRADGTPLPGAELRVEPGAYLPSPGHTRRMVPNRTTSVSLPLADPGPDAASYSVSLL